MATCDSLQPIVLLTDVMDCNSPCNSTEPDEIFKNQTQQTSLFQKEQTEPLNLCLSNNLSECAPSLPDDVIFVKEFQFESKRPQRKNDVKLEEPRRNPIRKARDKKRFKEYTDISFDEEEVEKDNSVCVAEEVKVEEDSEEWKIETVSRRGRPRRRVFTRKYGCRPGRRRKNPPEGEKKVPIEDLQELVESNLILIKEHISDVKFLNNIPEKDLGVVSGRIKTTVDIFKQQLILLRVIEGNSADLVKHLK